MTIMNNITIVVAYNKNLVIGNGCGLPWHIVDDLKFFKEVTMGKACVMGRKTWFAIPEKYRPLPGRHNIVVSRDKIELGPNVSLCSSVEEAIELGGSETCITGGGEIYRYCIENNLIDRVLASEIKNHLDVDGATFFPDLKKLGWQGKIIREFNEFDVVEYTK